MATKKTNKSKDRWKKIPKGKELDTIKFVMTKAKPKKKKAKKQIEDAFDHAIEVTMAAVKGTSRPLTAKESRFCDEYMIDFNATQAAKRAGYSKKTAQQIGAENLTKPVIKKVLQEKQFALKISTGITAENVARELARIGFADMRNYAYWEKNHIVLKNCEELTEDQAAAVTELTNTKEGVKIKLGDKVAALEKLGKHLGMFQENFNVIHKNPIPVDITNFTVEQAAQIYKNALKPTN